MWGYGLPAAPPFVGFGSLKLLQTLASPLRKFSNDFANFQSVEQGLKLHQLRPLINDLRTNSKPDRLRDLFQD